jgi:hypothetical protein
MASLTGLAAARHWTATVDGWDVRQEGLCGGRPPLVLYISEEGHSCMRKAAELLGLRGDPDGPSRRRRTHGRRRSQNREPSRRAKPIASSASVKALARSPSPRCAVAIAPSTPPSKAPQQEGGGVKRKIALWDWMESALAR